MTKHEAITKANEYTHEQHQVDAQPVEVHFVSRSGERPYWWVSYGTAIYHPVETAAGCTIDGGDYILKVDDATEEVTVL
jgi:hypothetical protein